MESDQEQSTHKTYSSQAAETAIGHGLIATADLAPETVVEEIEGPAAGYKEVLLRGEDSAIPRTNARYINHSCEANCYVSYRCEVVTTRAVSRGEELTLAYNGITMEQFLKAGLSEHFWDNRWTFQCRCGVPRCIGLIDRYVVMCADDSNTRNVYLGVTEQKGRGVFARRKIPVGTTIETSPVLIIPAPQWHLVAQSVLYGYAFEWGWQGEDAALAMGYGSLYNHSYTPNARYRKRLEDVAIDFVALRDIEQAEEIVINYNGDPGNQEPLWFL